MENQSKKIEDRTPGSELQMRIITILFIFALCAEAAKAGDASVIDVPIGKDISLKFTLEKFVKSENKLTDCGGGYICLINNQPFWGSDGALPNEVLEKLVLNLKGKKISLDTNGMYNPMIVSADKSRYQVVNYYDDVWKVRGKFSDGGAAYYAEWLVANGHAMRVVIGGTELLYDAFDYIFKNKP